MDRGISAMVDVCWSWKAREYGFRILWLEWEN